MFAEKDPEQDSVILPSGVDLANLDRPSRYKRVKALVVGLFLGVLGVGGLALHTIIPTLAFSNPPAQVTNSLCPQAKPITPVKHSAVWNTLVDGSASDNHRDRAIEWLSGAVRVKYVFHPSCVLQ